MKKIIINIILLLTVNMLWAQEQEIIKFYVGTFTAEGAEGIYLCNFNAENGDISLDKTFKGIDDPSFLKLSPNHKFLYVASRSSTNIEQSGGYVLAYNVHENGEIEFINKQVTHGTEPCHIDVSPDGKYVAIANYGSGTTALYPVEENGGLKPATSVIKNAEFEDESSQPIISHAHSIKFSPFGNQVYSADLGTDKLNIYSIEENKFVSGRQKFVQLETGAGPRHFDFHPGGKVLYVINELNSTITAFQISKNKLTEIQTVSTLPPGFEGKSYCADIHVSPDGRFVYGSNRGDNSIAAFVVISSSKKLLSIGTVETVGDWPRNFTLSPDGRFMLVANQRSGNITVFKINEEEGVPEYTGKELKLPSPVCIEFL